jgi:hypothetical protein
LANFGLIKEYLKDRNYENSKFESWQFKNDKDLPSINLALSNFEIDISNGQKQYDISWDYDLNANLYLKDLAGKKHLDNNGDQISASNVILQFVETEILDSELRLKIKLISKNTAVICSDGVCHSGYWQKDDENSRTRYYDENGEEFIFNSGKTWVHFIDENKVCYKVVLIFKIRFY